MGFLIRTAFWLSLVLLVIPLDVTGRDGGESAIGPVDALIAARGAIGDIAGMCERQPEVCAVGRSALHTIGLKAREGVRIAYDMLEEPTAEPAREPDRETMTGSVPAE